MIVLESFCFTGEVVSMRERNDMVSIMLSVVYIDDLFNIFFFIYRSGQKQKAYFHRTIRSFLFYLKTGEILTTLM